MYSNETIFNQFQKYFEIWGLNLIKIDEFLEAKKCDALIVDLSNDFQKIDAILDCLTINQPPTLDSGKKVVLLSPLSCLSAITHQLYKSSLQKEFSILTKPVAPLKLLMFMTSLLELQSPSSSSASLTSLPTPPLSDQDFGNPLIQPMEEKVMRTVHRISSNLNKGIQNKKDEPIQVLVVEDDPINQMVMSKLLEKLGVIFSIIPSAEEGVEIWKNSKPTIPLIFMDIEVDGPINGLEATSVIRTLEKSLQKEKRTHIIMMTGRSLEEDQIEARNLGCDDFFTKPMKLDLIVNLVKKFI